MLDDEKTNRGTERKRRSGIVLRKRFGRHSCIKASLNDHPACQLEPLSEASYPFVLPLALIKPFSEIKYSRGAVAKIRRELREGLRSCAKNKEGCRIYSPSLRWHAAPGGYRHGG